MNKFLHTSLCVSDLDASVDFYCNSFGFMVYKRDDKVAEGERTVLLRLPGNDHMLELSFSPGSKVAVPEHLVQTAIGVPNILSFCERLDAKGIALRPENWREVFGSTDKKKAFATDPDGYEVAILERK